MENPYQSPQATEGMPFSGSPFSEAGVRGLAHQVPIVAVLMMVQGGLEAVMSCIYLLLGSVLPFTAGTAAVPPGGAMPPGAPSPRVFFGFVAVIYLTMGGVSLAAGVFKLVAGWRNFRFRNRVLGVVGLLSGVASAATCYCLPTAVCLMIYGLIVYLNVGAAHAFQMGDQGFTPEQIRASWG